MTREEFDDFLVSLGAPNSNWDARYKLLAEYDRLVEKFEIKHRECESLYLEIERLDKKLRMIKKLANELLVMLFGVEP